MSMDPVIVVLIMYVSVNSQLAYVSVLVRLRSYCGWQHDYLCAMAFKTGLAECRSIICWRMHYRLDVHRGLTGCGFTTLTIAALSVFRSRGTPAIAKNN